MRNERTAPATSNANSINKCNLKWIALNRTLKTDKATREKKRKHKPNKRSKMRNKMSYMETSLPTFRDARTKPNKCGKKQPPKSRSDCNVATIRSNYVASLSSGNAKRAKKCSIYKNNFPWALTQTWQILSGPKLKLMKRYLIWVREAFKRYF